MLWTNDLIFVADISLPEGVDPSFLAALPDNIRQEVIAEQLRLQRIQQRAQQQTVPSSDSSNLEVNPEFLAALPLAIQEEASYIVYGVFLIVFLRTARKDGVKICYEVMTTIQLNFCKRISLHAFANNNSICAK